MKRLPPVMKALRSLRKSCSSDMVVGAWSTGDHMPPLSQMAPSVQNKYQASSPAMRNEAKRTNCASQIVCTTLRMAARTALLGTGATSSVTSPHWKSRAYVT
eukprot:CAMPEP_0119409662 /NCGR_PEP_ID=MMETSP1335-20130426/2900_1 /TAXON_ID=259385 /ORGANISM="Chrysoculter rhomboideus, Strain RCC1486" /LENGTH=101 /DNA_ID=CAMNT_0007434067 /DNA_START=501 /DNA_END=803 /DNA_ORIENTATION=-